MGTQNESGENFQDFVDRCEALFPHDRCVQLKLVYRVAKGCHHTQVRKDEKNEDGTPVRYFEHVRRTGLIVMDEARLGDWMAVAEALLHDAYEDTHLTAEEIHYLIGPEGAQGVLLMSKRPKTNFISRLTTHATWRELAVKVADRIDNLRHLAHSSPEFRAKQVTETTQLYLTLAALLQEKVPIEHAAAAARLQRLLIDALAAVPR